MILQFFKDRLFSNIILTFLCFWIESGIVEAQVVLYMEEMTSEKPIKYYPGDKVNIKTSTYPDEWMNIKIEKILTDDGGVIVYDGGLVHIKDITHVRRIRKWVRPLTYSLQTFGTAWVGLGALGLIFGQPSITFGSLAIGGGAFVIGFLVRKAFLYKKYKIGKKVRLKYLDISWPQP